MIFDLSKEEVLQAKLEINERKLKAQVEKVDILHKVIDLEDAGKEFDRFEKLAINMKFQELDKTIHSENWRYNEPYN